MVNEPQKHHKNIDQLKKMEIPRIGIAWLQKKTIASPQRYDYRSSLGPMIVNTLLLFTLTYTTRLLSSY